MSMQNGKEALGRDAPWHIERSTDNGSYPVYAFPRCPSKYKKTKRDKRSCYQRQVQTGFERHLDTFCFSWLSVEIVIGRVGGVRKGGPNNKAEVGQTRDTEVEMINVDENEGEGFKPHCVMDGCQTTSKVRKRTVTHDRKWRRQLEKQRMLTCVMSPHAKKSIETHDQYTY